MSTDTDDKPMDAWFRETGFCAKGCGMWGVNHAENDAVCRRRQAERYERPGCALVYVPDW